MKKRMVLSSLIFVLGMSIASCGTAGASKEEYDKVVAERDKYKQMYEELSDNGKKSAFSDSNSKSNELELWEVELTTDNVDDFLLYGIADEKNAFGEATGVHYLVSYSKVINDGWYLYDMSEDFAIEFTFDDGYTTQHTTLYTILTGFNDENGYTSDSVTVTRVKGKVTFVNKNSVTKYILKDGEREIGFADGTEEDVYGGCLFEDFPY